MIRATLTVCMGLLKIATAEDNNQEAHTAFEAAMEARRKWVTMDSSQAFLSEYIPEEFREEAAQIGLQLTMMAAVIGLIGWGGQKLYHQYFATTAPIVHSTIHPNPQGGANAKTTDSPTSAPTVTRR